MDARMENPQLHQMLIFYRGLRDAVRAGVPPEHQGKLFDGLSPLTEVYTQPAWVSRYGSLKSIQVAWLKNSQQYDPVSGSSEIVSGEVIIFTATFATTNGNKTLTAKWWTRFPNSVSSSTTHIGAIIDIGDAFIPWILRDDRDESFLTQLATSATDWQIRQAAVAQLTDQEVLAKIAVKDDTVEDCYVRQAASRRLDVLRRMRAYSTKRDSSRVEK